MLVEPGYGNNETTIIIGSLDKFDWHLHHLHLQDTTEENRICMTIIIGIMQSP